MCEKECLAALTARAIALGASGTAIIPVDKIVFEPDFRKACTQNACGKYNRCWMCPPDAGQIDELIRTAQTYRWAFVFQTVSPLENSFDIAGMLEAGQRHNALMRQLSAEAQELHRNTLRLGGGACGVCERCGKIDNIPCRNPHEATSSLEAYGIDVTKLAALCKLRYIAGAGTVTYFGALLFR